MALELRRDDGLRKRRRLAITAIGLGMIAAWVLPNWWFAGAPPSPAVTLVPIMIWMACTMVIFFVFIRPPGSYRCPRCQQRLPRAEDARPLYRFRCEPCGVEWDLQESDDCAGE